MLGAELARIGDHPEGALRLLGEEERERVVDHSLDVVRRCLEGGARMRLGRGGIARGERETRELVVRFGGEMLAFEHGPCAREVAGGKQCSAEAEAREWVVG